MIVMAEDCPYEFGAGDLRREEPGWTLGERVRPGMLIAEGPHHCPYLIERITPQDEHYQAPCWGLTGWYAPGGRAERSEHQRWWLNGQVATRYAPAPLGIVIRPLGVYRYDCPARDFCFVIVGHGTTEDRAGQLGLAF